jgi:lipoate-protein ligase A
MRLLELTLSTPAENIALDEALLLEIEQQAVVEEVLRIWEAATAMVVVGRGSSVAEEVNEEACRRDDVPILRRSSGGTSVVAAPGCLMYALVLRYDQRAALHAIDQAHQHVLARMERALTSHVPDVRRAGVSDLAVGDRKISGNSLRCRHNCLLYHGTLLYDMSADLMQRYLKRPPRQPEYRAGRSHDQFVTNLPVGPDVLRDALVTEWGPTTAAETWPAALTSELVETKYSKADWNYCRP